MPGETEQKIIHEVKHILSTNPFQALCTAFKQGISHTEAINGRVIQVDPELPFSGMTLFKENGFVLGKEAFKGKEELIKTLLHEIYRLEKSAIGKAGRASQEEITEETKAAFEFAEKSFTLFF